MTGNLMGDFKPNTELLAQLPGGIKRGIENHRLVDRLTDKYQPVKELRKLFSGERRRYAGVVTDIAFDYFLIKHWDVQRDGDLDKFIASCYRGLGDCRGWMPPRMAYVTEKMEEHDWLTNYATLEGVGLTIDQVSKRIRFRNNMAGSVVEVERNYQAIEAAFVELIEYLREQITAARIEV